MIRSRLLSRSYFLRTSFGLCLFLLFSGCQQAKQPPQNYVSALTSHKGIQIERLMPADTTFFIKAGATNDDQEKNLQQILQNFPQEDWKTFSNFITSSFNESFKNENLSFEQEIMPAMGKNIQIGIALLNWEKQGQSLKTNMLVFVPLTETEKFSQALDKTLKKEGFTVSQYSNSTIYSKNESMPTETCIALYQDVLLISSNKEILQQALDRANSQSPSFIEGATYQKALASVKDGIGFMYLNTPLFLQELRNMAPQQSIIDNSSSQESSAPSSSYSNIVDGKILNVIAVNDGFQLSGTTFLNEEKAKEYKIDIQSLPTEEAYLYKKIPAEKIIYYGETYNVKKFLEMNSVDIQNNPKFKEMIENIKFYLALEGIDPNKDLAFLDRGMALVIREGHWLIPGVDVYFDASSYPDGAKKVMAKIYSLADSFLKQSQLNSKTQNIFTSQKIAENQYRFVADFNKLPDLQKKNMPKQMLEQSMVIEYGLNDNNLAYISLMPTISTKTVADDENFNKAKNSVKNFNNGISYINPQELLQYIKMVKAMAEEKGTLPENTSMIFDKIEAYMAPVKSLILSSTVKGSEIQINGFIPISK